MTYLLLTGRHAEQMQALYGRTWPTASDLSTVPEAAMRDPDDVQIVDGVAAISVRGVLTKKLDATLKYWGIENTSYAGIIAQVERAKSKNAKAIQLTVDSGGGAVDGLYEAMDAIRASGIPTTAKVEGMAASAAYMLASQAMRIEADSPLSLVGSVGVATTVYTSEYRRDIANRDSAKKRPDVATEEGVAVVQDELDDIYNVLAERIAEGRAVDVETVNEKFGQGAVMTARKALAAGMIDSIGKPNAGTPAGLTIQGEENMDRAKLKAEHPDLFASLMAEGIAAGRAECLEVVAGHLSLAEASGDMDRAVADIRAMNPVTSSVLAHHTAASIRRANIAARQEEAPAAVVANEGGMSAESFEKEKAEINAMIPGVKVEW
jgi:ClpP class serine protease